MDAGGLKRAWKRIIRDAGVGHVRFHDLLSWVIECVSS
jgi:hypothetical protein